MTDSRLEGKLGIECVTVFKGCCADTVLDWKPRMIGEKNTCMFCGNPMKTIRAGEVDTANYTGMLNETAYKEDEDPNLIFAELWFTERRFNLDQVKEWCDARSIQPSAFYESDGMAFRVKLAEFEEDTARMVWAAPGVIAVAGVRKMGLADMAGGGLINPTLGTPPVEETTTPDSGDATTTEKEGEGSDILQAFSLRLNETIASAK